jgi:energy-coupling factor transporter ATP-binding protein EcfA2
MAGKMLPDDDDNDDDEDLSEGKKPFDSSWFNSFVFSDDSKTIVDNESSVVSTPNIQIMKEYYKKDYLNNLSEKEDKKTQSDISIDMRRIFDVLKNFKVHKKNNPNAKPFMFILPDVSRYMTKPGDPSNSENPVLMILFNITQIEDTDCKVLLFVDKMNDLPTWFESENNNSAIKKIFVPTPSTEFRKEFFSIELSEAMNSNVGLEEKDIQDRRDKFAAYTEGYSIRRLKQLKKFILSGNSDYLDFNNLDKTILKFDVGETEDPWRSKGLKDTIKELTDLLGKEIKGQGNVIDNIKKALEVAATGVKSSKKNDRRPRAVLMFAGPTGVGKTELAKQIAEKIFKNQDSMIRFDMSEFKDEHTDSRLFGAPPGYVGYEAGGELTKAIKQKPFSVVLFDEIEKASPRIWDKFLQILGDGRLTDGKGETVSFTQSIIIFTSNLGITADSSDFKMGDRMTSASTQDIDRKINELTNKLLEAVNEKQEEASLVDNEEAPKDPILELVKELKELELSKIPLVGLSTNLKDSVLIKRFYRELGLIKRNLEYDDSEAAFNSFVEDSVKSRVYQYFERIGRREVLGRIGDNNILVFNFISETVAKHLAKLKIEKFTNKLLYENENHIKLVVENSALQYIYSKVQEKEILNFGGRGIEDFVDKTIGDLVSKFILTNANCMNATATIYFENDMIDIK